MSILICFSSTS